MQKDEIRTIKITEDQAIEITVTRSELRKIKNKALLQSNAQLVKMKGGFFIEGTREQIIAYRVWRDSKAKSGGYLKCTLREEIQEIGLKLNTGNPLAIYIPPRRITFFNRFDNK